jgi:hypothetical protein
LYRSYPEKHFVFGDNVQRTGFAGQAKEMRENRMRSPLVQQALDPAQHIQA